MGLGIALSNALSGLNVNQQALTVLSQNIANANTPGYSRQILNLQAAYLDGQGAGVNIEDITRTVDQYLQNSIVQQTSTTGTTGVLNDYNSRIQLLLGTPGDGDDISSTITNFFTSLQTLAQAPSDPTDQESAVQAGSALATQMNSLATGLQGLRFQADQDISTSVAAINTDLKNLYTTNGAIANATALGQSVAGLQDTQTSLLNDLSQYMNIQTIGQSNNTINVYTSNGTTLVDTSLHQLTYTPASSVQTFENNTTLSPIQVENFDNDGNVIGQPSTLVTGGPSSQVTSTLTSGKLSGLLQMRDQQIPGMLAQIDQLTSSLRDQVNALHNSGSGYPGANSLTGTNLVSASDFSQWSGSAQIAVLDQNGQPIASPYPDQTAYPPLTLNLSTLNTGNGAGNPSVQGIINQINQYYTPQNKVELGNLNNIQLMSDSADIPSVPPQLNFDFNLQNLSSSSSNLFVTGVQVKDDNGNPITTGTLPTAPLAISSYQTSLATPNTVTVNTTGSTSGLSNGQQIYLSDPGGDINGIPEADLSGVFTISNVTANSFQITVADGATSASTVAPSGSPTALQSYGSVAANSTARTSANGTITADLTGYTGSSYYDVTVNAIVTDASGNTSSSAITYRVFNNTTNALNSSYAAQTATNDGNVIAPTSATPVAQAILVDANGNELPKINGQYTTLEKGYLEIKATNSNNVIAIDSMDSSEQGQPNNIPPIPGTNRGFSYYFDLNDFFQAPAAGTNQVTNSALNLQVQQRLVNDPGLISTGTLSQSSTTPYASEMDPGDNSAIQNLSALASQLITFSASGSIGQTTETLSDYAGEVVGSASTTATTAQTNDTNANTLLTGYQQQSSSVSGVNLNTELANTVIYQNAYAASARVITVTNDLFTTLLQTFQ